MNKVILQLFRFLARDVYQYLWDNNDILSQGNVFLVPVGVQQSESKHVLKWLCMCIHSITAVLPQQSDHGGSIPGTQSMSEVLPLSPAQLLLQQQPGSTNKCLCAGGL
jgi:hypothetical protein